MKTGRAAYAAVLAVACAACSSDPLEAPVPTHIQSATYELIFERARDVGVSDDQAEELRLYADGREIPFEVVTDATQRTFACFEQAGLQYDYTTTYSLGQQRYEYRWFVPEALSPEQARDVGDACVDRESALIVSMYEHQPSYIETRDAAFEQVRADVLDCLQGYGTTLGENATRDEAWQAASELLVTGVVSEPTCFPPE